MDKDPIITILNVSKEIREGMEIKKVVCGDDGNIKTIRKGVLALKCPITELKFHYNNL